MKNIYTIYFFSCFFTCWASSSVLLLSYLCHLSWFFCVFFCMDKEMSKKAAFSLCWWNYQFGEFSRFAFMKEWIWGVCDHRHSINNNKQNWERAPLFVYKHVFLVLFKLSSIFGYSGNSLNNNQQNNVLKIRKCERKKTPLNVHVYNDNTIPHIEKLSHATTNSVNVYFMDP